MKNKIFATLITIGIIVLIGIMGYFMFRFPKMVLPVMVTTGLLFFIRIIWDMVYEELKDIP